jgi:hypothetical protein
MMKPSLYDRDLYAWTLEQAQFLQQNRWQSLDIENLVEEIESLRRQQKQELRNCLRILIGHLLKWELQPEMRSKSWKATIREQRKEILLLLKDNPSLKSYLAEAVEDGYELGMALVVRETQLDYPDLPLTCPYSVEQALDPGFPEELLKELGI